MINHSRISTKLFLTVGLLLLGQPRVDALSFSSALQKLKEPKVLAASVVAGMSLYAAYQKFVSPTTAHKKATPEPLVKVAYRTGELGLVHESACHYGIQGLRPTMEDEHEEFLGARYAFYLVCDGHGGDLAAQYTAATVHDNVFFGLEAGKSIEKALFDGFIKTDIDFCKAELKSGTTAVAAFIDKDAHKIYIANTGDSRAVLGVYDDELNMHPRQITIDHHPSLPAEHERICSHKLGFVARGRVCGRLALSRAIGDCKYREMGVIPDPDIFEVDITAHEDFLILACDGIWNFMTPTTAIEIVDHTLQTTGRDVKAAAKELVMQAFEDCRSSDNISVTVVDLRPLQPKEGDG